MDQTIVALTQESFAENTSSGVVFVNWWTSWCKPCRAFASVYLAAARRHLAVLWCKVDVDAEPELAAAFAIRSLPTLTIFRDGILLYARPGALPGATLDDLVERTLTLDMDKVRSALEREESAQTVR